MPVLNEVKYFRISHLIICPYCGKSQNQFIDVKFHMYRVEGDWVILPQPFNQLAICDDDPTTFPQGCGKQFAYYGTLIPEVKTLKIDRGAEK